MRFFIFCAAFYAVKAYLQISVLGTVLRSGTVSNAANLKSDRSKVTQILSRRFLDAPRAGFLKLL